MKYDPKAFDRLMRSLLPPDTRKRLAAIKAQAPVRTEIRRLTSAAGLPVPAAPR